jgi:arylformamidase
MDVNSCSVAELEANFTPLIAVPDNEAYIQRGSELSALARKRLRCSLDVSYGETRLQKLDIFHADNTDAPVVIFIHGGYWYILDKSYVAGPLTGLGATTVLINYDLCPVVSKKSTPVQLA